MPSVNEEDRHPRYTYTNVHVTVDLTGQKGERAYSHSLRGQSFSVLECVLLELILLLNYLDQGR